MIEEDAIQYLLDDHAIIDKFPWNPNVDVILGCGTYGCVFETSDPDVVCKVTSDDQEIRIVSKIIDENLTLDGFVRYYAIVSLGEVHCLWREKVDRMGNIVGYHDALNLIFDFFRVQEHISYALYQTDNERALIESARSYESWAQKSHLSLRGLESHSGPKKLAGLLNLYYRYAVSIQQTKDGKAIGDSLLKLWDYDIVMTDVKYKNLGIVTRNTQNILVIADPSLPVFLR